MKRQLAVLLLSAIVLPVYAQGEVYMCIDSNGNREYKNTGSVTRCKKVDLPGVSTVPASLAKKPATQTASAKPSSPTDFPRVDNTIQKARDSDRKQILLDEMKAEEQKLAGIRREYNNGEPERRGDERNYAKYQERSAALKDDLARTEKNVEALKRELGNLK